MPDPSSPWRRLALATCAIALAGACASQFAVPPAETPTAAPLVADAAADYFALVLSTDPAVNSANGRIARWTRMPVRVYLDTASPPEDFDATHVDAARQAVAAWNVAAAGVVSLALVADAGSADVTVSWVYGFEGPYVGYTTWKTETGQDMRVHVRLPLHHGDGRRLSPRLIRVSALHELGHGLGIWAHSDNTDDIMFPVLEDTTRTAISPRDIRTLGLVYQAVPDVTRAD